MKKIILFSLCLMVFSTSNAQATISPSQSNEYCPGVENTFTVTIPKPYQSMIGIGGCFVTQLPAGPVGTTFTFKGKFGDANQKQIFRIFHPDGSKSDFDFKKIKSLYYSTTCTQVPNQVPITVARCQIVNVPISVPNVQWGTEFESPTLCFGSISAFEYQIPNGWSIAGQPSNGSNWIAGGNNVTVTSDLSTGDGGAILVRPRTDCGSGLQNGQSPGVIPISRPAPNLQITSSDGRFYVCSGTRNFTLNNIPAGATVHWELLSTVNATISGPTNQPTVTIQRNTATNTTVGLKVTVTHCSFSYEKNKTIILGTGITDFTFTSLYNTVTNISGYPEAFVWATVNDVPDALYYSWFYKKHIGPGPGGGGGTFTWVGSTGGNHNEFTLPECDKNYTIKVEVGTSCGTDVTNLYEGLLNADCGSSFRISLSPNPATAFLNVEVNSEKDNNKIEQFEIRDKMGIALQKGSGNKNRQLQVNVSQLKNGQYIMRIFNGKIWSSKIFIKQ